MGTRYKRVAREGPVLCVLGRSHEDAQNIQTEIIKEEVEGMSIIVVVRDGFVQGVTVDGKEYEAIVFDYDVEGIPDHPEIETDDYGRPHLTYVV